MPKLRRRIFLSERTKKIPESGVRAIFRLARMRKDIIDLSIGEPDFPTPHHIIKAAVNAMKKGYTHYTPNAGLLEFREAVAEKLKRENKIDANPETEIIATVGSMGAISLLMFVLIDQGDEILIPCPGFANYEAHVLMAGGKPIPYKLSENGEFQPDLEEISNLITDRTKGILINTPSNPTGMVLGRDVLKGIVDLASEKNLTIISDEAYEKIIYEDAEHISVASLPGAYERTISIFSLSKTYAMTGWRIGYAVSTKEIISQMTKLQEHLVAHPSSISQIAGAAALRGSQKCVKEMVKEYSERREIIIKALSKINRVRYIEPRGTFYVFPSISELGVSSYKAALYLLEKAGVAVVPGIAFGKCGENHIRISFSISKNILAKAIERLKNALEKY